MAPTLVSRGSIRGPQGLTGPQGVQGPPGRTLDPEGTEPTKTSLAARTGMVKGQAWVVAENRHLYVYEGNEAPTSGVGFDAALPGYTDMGDIQGPKGDTGAQGPQGVQGATGPQGPTGAKGDTGAQGLPGAQGIQGAQGATGPKGDIGNTGAQGIQGVKGDTGATGAQGTPGTTGAQGPQGVQGVVGANGSRIYSFGGNSGRTQAQALAASAVNDVLIDLDTGTYYDVIDV